MLVFLIVLVLTIGLGILSHYLKKKDSLSNTISNAVLSCEILFVVGIFMAVIMLVVIIFNNASGNVSYEKTMAEREVIEYQLENQTFVNDNFVGTNELFTQIGEFNGKVKSHQMYHNSIWTNWFYSNVWNEIELIDISQYNIQG